MTNKEFFELSEKKVKKLNGSTDEKSYEAWRDGYNYLANKVRESMQNDYNHVFLDKMEEIADSELEVFEFNLPTEK